VADEAKTNQLPIPSEKDVATGIRLKKLSSLEEIERQLDQMNKD